MIKIEYAKRWLRPLMLFGSMLLLLIVVYRPAHSTFHSTGDVQLYQVYGRQALDWPIELPREYPALSAAIFVLPQLFLPEQYMVGFAALMMVAAGFTVIIVDRLAKRGWRLALYLALGGWGTLFFRYDVVVVLVTVLAFWAALRQRWALSQVLLGLGVALKLYPVVLMPLVVLWQWRATQRLPWRATLTAAVMVVLVGGGTWLLSPDAAVEMLRLLRERPIEFEALAASVAWLFGPTATELSYGSINVISPLTPWITPILTPLTMIALLGVYLATARGFVAPTSAWAISLGALLLSSKVFSTQYLLWILPFVALAQATTATSRDNRVDDTSLWSLICLLTMLVFPVGEEYWGRTVQLALVSVRNILLLVGLLRLLRPSDNPTLLQRCWLAWFDEIRFWRQHRATFAGLVVCVLILNVISLRVFSSQSYMLDVGAWNDEEILRYRGMYRQESDDLGSTYRWTSDWSTIRISSVRIAAQPLVTLLFGGVPAAAALPRLVALTADDVTLTLEATLAPRRYHLLLPATTFLDNNIDMLLQSPTSEAPPDPRQLGVRLDTLTLSAIGRLPVPAPQTVLVQLIAILVAAGLTRRAFIPAAGQLFVAVILGIGLAVIAGRFMMIADAWQSRLLVVCCVGVIIALSISPRQRQE